MEQSPTSTHRIRLRPATLDDVEVLRHWDSQPHVIASDPNDDWQWETELGKTPDWREQLIAEVAQKPIGFIQIIDPALEEEHYWGDVGPDHRAIDIWIGEANELGKGYGTEMMTQAINRCFAASNVKSILIDPLESNIRAHRFYQRLGFRFLRRWRFDQDDCLVFELTRLDWQRRGGGA